ncbi:hypothetical protein [Sorangium sp. So ce1099]|uniref:hypothetical protein n=1 Tax=Sorangium sp. So ce1099 TaxID=3133331 RepID=UPI003F6314A3
MNKRKKARKEPRASTAHPSAHAAEVKSPAQPLAHSSQIRMIIPGGLVYQLPLPSGVPPYDRPRRAHLHVLKEASVLASIPRSELSAIIASLAATYARAAYHESRFFELRRELDKRRENMPGEILWDNLIEYVHFELQAFAGASRMLLDELVYLIARRHGIPSNRAKKKPWETSDLVQRSRAAECDVQEVRLLASKASWFGTLNAYRNSFFHHGWRHGSGHFPLDDVRPTAASPVSNGLLVPDKASLGGRSKPFEWTWTQKVTVDDVAREIRVGTEEFLTGLLESLWSTPPPPPGSAPLSEYPNLLVVLAKPAFIETPRAIYLPFFSSRDRGLAFQLFAKDPRLELVDVPVSSAVIGQRALTVSLSGLEKNEIYPGVEFVEAVLDPEASGGWVNVQAAARIRIPLRELWAAKVHCPVSIPVSDLERAWVWRSSLMRDWDA